MIGYTTARRWLAEMVIIGPGSPHATRHPHAAMPAAKRQLWFETCTVPCGAVLSTISERKVGPMKRKLYALIFAAGFAGIALQAWAQAPGHGMHDPISVLQRIQ